MFTGIVEELGTVIALEFGSIPESSTPESSTLDGSAGVEGQAADPAATRESARLTVHAPLVTSDARHGDSICVDGVCLTVVDRGDSSFTADVMAETLRRSTVGTLRPGAPVNLERSVLPVTRMGGHIVQGHVDGVGTLIARQPHPAYDEITLEVPRSVGRYLAPKGAIAVDGISLTVIDVLDTVGDGDDVTHLTIGVIPETRTATTLGTKAVGSAVNIEVDVVAKYVERLLVADRERE